MSTLVVARTKKKLVERDPPIRKDGLCALTGCKKPRYPTNRYSDPQQDPFCSAACCRVYWDAVQVSPSSSPR